jgi:hypothetical protein
VGSIPASRTTIPYINQLLCNWNHNFAVWQGYASNSKRQRYASIFRCCAKEIREAGIRRTRIYRLNGLREAAQAINDGDQEIIQSTVFELIRLHGELSTADLFLLN